MKSITFPPGSFTHITVLYFTICNQGKEGLLSKLLQLAYSWWVLVFTVDRDNLDPILLMADIFVGGVDPQRLKDRIMETRAGFQTRDYKARFSIEGDNSYLDETFTHKSNGEVRKTDTYFTCLLKRFKHSTGMRVHSEQ